MSMFSTKGGLYERAQKRFSVQDGKKLFTYSFYEKQKLEAMAFFSEIYTEAVKAKPGPGHWAIASMADAGLRRHYTLNIDGLSETAGMSTWHPSLQPQGQVVEMHGNIRQLVCVQCRRVQALTPATLRRLKAKQRIACPACRGGPAMRCRIMLYDDAEDDAITPDDVFDLMEEDIQAADLILWVGISFEQSASTSYFRRARAFLHSVGRLGQCMQAVINPSEDSLWNLTSACSNMGNMGVLEVLGASDEVLPLLASALAAGHQQRQRRQQQPETPPALPAHPGAAPAALKAHGAAGAAVQFGSCRSSPTEDQSHRQQGMSAGHSADAAAAPPPSLSRDHAGAAGVTHRESSKAGSVPGSDAGTGASCGVGPAEESGAALAGGAAEACEHAAQPAPAPQQLAQRPESRRADGHASELGSHAEPSAFRETRVLAAQQQPPAAQGAPETADQCLEARLAGNQPKQEPPASPDAPDALDQEAAPDLPATFRPNHTMGLV